MRRAYRSVLVGVLYLALAIAQSAAATAPPASQTAYGDLDLTEQRKALYQAELEQNLLLRTQLGYGFIVAPLPAPPT